MARLFTDAEIAAAVQNILNQVRPGFDKIGQSLSVNVQKTSSFTPIGSPKKTGRFLKFTLSWIAATGKRKALFTILLKEFAANELGIDETDIKIIEANVAQALSTNPPPPIQTQPVPAASAGTPPVSVVPTTTPAPAPLPLPTTTPSAPPPPTPTPAPAETSQPWQRFAANQIVKVCNTSGQGLNFRQRPGTSQPILFARIEGSQEKILGYEAFIDGFHWWFVQDENNQNGYMADPFLCPL